MGYPQTPDGKRLVTTNCFPNNLVVQMVGAEDDATNGRGEGPKFQLTRSDDGEAELDFQFLDAIHMTSGVALFKGAILGDWAEFKAYAPATVATLNESDTGNCNLIDIPNTGGTLHIIIPAAGDGAYDVDLEDCVPVPNPTHEGYVSVESNDIGPSTITWASGAGGHDLYDFAMDLNRFAAYCPLLGSGKVEYGIENVRAAKVLPEWKFHVKLHNEGGSHTVEMAWFLILARLKTVGI